MDGKEVVVDYGKLVWEEKRGYVGGENEDKGRVVELKKIVEMEGVVDRYRDMFEKEDIRGWRYGINNYRGLKWVGGRLKDRYWEGW